MKLIQVVLPDDQLTGHNGGYYAYEFGFVSEEQPNNTVRKWIDFPVLSPEMASLADEDEDFLDTREQFSVDNDELNIIGDFE